MKKGLDTAQASDVDVLVRYDLADYYRRATPTTIRGIVNYIENGREGDELSPYDRAEKVRAANIHWFGKKVTSNRLGHHENPEGTVLSIAALMDSEIKIDQRLINNNQLKRKPHKFIAVVVWERYSHKPFHRKHFSDLIIRE